MTISAEIYNKKLEAYDSVLEGLECELDQLVLSECTDDLLLYWQERKITALIRMYWGERNEMVRQFKDGWCF